MAALRILNTIYLSIFRQTSATSLSYGTSNWMSQGYPEVYNNEA
ncbi:Uncharacterised protein [Serratia fonticola]|uniref:Uncharacterized protein n=1 Tax=Serratia fonticola TaxID=47917 RepID=A0A448T7K4_SERFO|nr:Uncharacterised protein [Serratia fonticola]